MKIYQSTSKTKKDDPEAIERPAVVTIMGHVDHGKTTLLDSIRHTKVTAGEAGGILNILVHIKLKTMAKNHFLRYTGTCCFYNDACAWCTSNRYYDFSSKAADDGVMPQTIEAINHAKEAEVPIIVAVNKIDKPTSNPDRVMQELTEYGLIPEDWGGGNNFSVPLSALRCDGIDDLLEMIGLVAEVQELKANPKTMLLVQLSKLN